MEKQRMHTLRMVMLAMMVAIGVVISPILRIEGILFAVPDRVPCEWASRCAGTSDLCLCDSIDSAFSVSGAGVHGWNGKLSGRDQPCIGNPDPADTVCKYDHGRCNHSLSDDWTRAWRSV